MDFISIMVIAAALAMDAFSVSISCGMTIEKPDIGHYFRLSFHFGLFQFAMPVIGYFLGSSFGEWINAYDHWVAFGLLFLIGARMIQGSFSKKEGPGSCKDPSRGMTLVLLALATSIDALAVGLSIGVLDRPILVPGIIIGVVCSLFSVIGIYLGNRVSAYITRGAEAIGGVMLIIIGVRIVIEHLS